MSLLARPMLFCGREIVLACDGRCDLAWGMERRRRRMLSAGDPDDFVYLGDGHPDVGSPPPPRELGCEGGDFKPSAVQLTDGSDKMNRWCARQCERSVGIEPRLPNLVSPVRNKPMNVRHSPSCVCVDCCAG